VTYRCPVCGYGLNTWLALDGAIVANPEPEPRLLCPNDGTRLIAVPAEIPEAESAA
jgi:hypothetical protein